jgi:hypothetical protein
MKTAVYSLSEIDLQDKTNNLLLNMSGGLLPEYLSKEEVLLLKNRFGENWFESLGYSEPEYKEPGLI